MHTHYEIDKTELQRLCNYFGLVWPVHVQGSAMKKHHGTYHGLSAWTVKNKVLNGKHHQVALGSTTTAERLNETIIHEVVHAVQQERMITTGVAVPDEKYHEPMKNFQGRMKKWDKYWNSPKEVEARTVAQMLKNSFQIVKPKPGRDYVVWDNSAVVRRYTIIRNARGPAAARAKCAQWLWGDSYYARDLGCRVLTDKLLAQLGDLVEKDLTVRPSGNICRTDLL